MAPFFMSVYRCKHLNRQEKSSPGGFANAFQAAIMRADLGRCRSGRTGRIRNPLCQQWHLGFESLSPRHIQNPDVSPHRGFLLSAIYSALTVQSWSKRVV